MKASMTEGFCGLKNENGVPSSHDQHVHPQEIAVGLHSGDKRSQASNLLDQEHYPSQTEVHPTSLSPNFIVLCQRLNDTLGSTQYNKLIIIK